MMWNLGIVVDKNSGAVINHRSLLKVLLNPFLRTKGWQIGTNYDGEKLGRPKIMRCQKRDLEFSFDYKLGDNCQLINERRFI